MKKLITLAIHSLLFTAIFGIFAPLAHATTATFNYTGGQQTWVVPTGVTSITVNASGARSYTSYGGLGGRVESTITTTPGETLYIYVGGMSTASNPNWIGGYNGGGDGNKGLDQYSSFGGGGASDIRQGGTALANRIVVAGGGGAAGGSTVGAAGAGGAGGTAAGSSGGGGAGDGGAGGAANTAGVSGGVAGGTGAAGLGGSGSIATKGLPGTAGSLGVGGSGANTTGTGGAGGGGGGGYNGGGGGGSGNTTGGGGGGGGGGSSYSSGTSTSFTQGYQSSNGQIVITYTPPPCAPPVSGSYTPTLSCSFANTIDGVDAGTGTTNTAVLTVGTDTQGAPVTLTVQSGQTIATGPISLTGGNIVIIQGGIIKPRTPLYIADADNDGYPGTSTTTQYISAAANRARRGTTTDCNDSLTGNNYTLSNNYFIDDDTDGYTNSNTTGFTLYTPCSSNSTWDTSSAYSRSGFGSNYATFTLGTQRNAASATLDCNDSLAGNNYTLGATYYVDTDADTYTSGSASAGTAVCSTGSTWNAATQSSINGVASNSVTFSAGTRRTAASGQADCNNSLANNQYTLSSTYYPDADLDNYTLAAASAGTAVCSTGSTWNAATQTSVAGVGSNSVTFTAGARKAAASSPLDCNDANGALNTSCGGCWAWNNVCDAGCAHSSSFAGCDGGFPSGGACSGTGSGSCYKGGTISGIICYYDSADACTACNNLGYGNTADYLIEGGCTWKP